MQRLDPKQCAVLVVDVQEKLAPAMPPAQMADLNRAAMILIESAAILGAKLIVTEQYPAGLGHTIAPIAERLDRLAVKAIEKVDFSACDAPSFQHAWAASGARAAIVIGMETHICVFQTVRELLARGVTVLVPIDGVASRREDHRIAGIELCRSMGATITTAETVAFDWLRRAGTDEFKKVSKLVR